MIAVRAPSSNSVVFSGHVCMYVCISVTPLIVCAWAMTYILGGVVLISQCACGHNVRSADNTGLVPRLSKATDPQMLGPSLWKLFEPLHGLSGVATPGPTRARPG